MPQRKRIKIAICWLLLLASLFFLVYTCDFVAQKRRARVVLPLAKAASEEFGVPVAMILAVIRAESDFYANAVSRVGAMGLMQLMPDTFSWLCEELNESYNAQKISDPATNVRYGTYYLAYLYTKFSNWRVALAAYNAGEGNVTEWLSDPSLSSSGTLRRIPFPETAIYVKKTLEFYVDYLDTHPIKENKRD